MIDRFINQFCITPRPIWVRCLDAGTSLTVLVFWLLVFPPVLLLLLNPNSPIRQQFSREYWRS